jgi:HD-like signal output (HDOD) protein
MGKTEALKALGSRLRLPTLPDVVVKINAMIADRTCGPVEIGQVVARDPELTASVLSAVNSTFFGLQEAVLTAEQAATVIGVRSLRNIALQVSIVQRYVNLARFRDFDLDEVWNHATGTAQIAQLLGSAGRVRTELAPDEYFTCGLLHDLGKVALLESLGDDYMDLIAQARQRGCSLHAQEVPVLGFSHMDVGALIAARWKLPSAVSLAIAYHHGPRARIHEHPVVAAVAIADQLSYRSRCLDFERVAERLEAIASRVLQVTPAAYARILESVARWQAEARVV